MEKHIHWACWLSEMELRNAVLSQIARIKKADFPIRSSLEGTKLAASLVGVGDTTFETATPMGAIAPNDALGLLILFGMAGKPNTFAVTRSDGKLIANISQKAEIIKDLLPDMETKVRYHLLVTAGLVNSMDAFSAQASSYGVRIPVQNQNNSQTTETSK